MGTDERWKKLEGIWRAALEREPESRSAFVREACAGDMSLEAEVESLLAHDGGSFLEEPSLTGRMIQQYAVLEKIGAGGMGEVFRARDTRLNRTVALKLLPRGQFSDPERRRRFVKEARAASALSHPNIVTVHDIVEADGHDAIVMEHVAGRPLGQLIPMTVGQALDYAVQIAEGLAAAHAAGIVHRDIKPGNILVTDDGRVKIVDFGLAKVVGGQDASTESGLIAGTVAYMSPEQAHGRPVDARSDIFSFGAVLYEMVSGRRAFKRDSTASTLAAVIDAMPEPLGKVPAELEKLIWRCLQKDAGRRWQHTSDLVVALREIREGLGERRVRVPWRWVAAGVVLLAGVAGWLGWRRDAPQVGKVRLTQLTTNKGHALGASFSPDGSQVAFSWSGEDGKNTDIYVKLVGEPSALRLTTDAAYDNRPAWSPDGKRIAFVRVSEDGRSSIYTISPLGGPERKHFDAPLWGRIAWTSDSKWLVGGTSGGNEPNGIFLFPVEGGEPRRLTRVTAPVVDHSVAISADGRRLGFARCLVRFSCDVFVQELTADHAAQGVPRQVTRQGYGITGATWVGDSLVYSGSAVWGMSHQLWRVKADGGSEPERVEYSRNNALNPAYSPAANRLVFARNFWNTDIWQYHTGSATLAPVIASSVDDSNPQYSPDGTRILFCSDRGGTGYPFWIANADGSNPVPVRTRNERGAGSPRWSPDGRSFVYDAQEPDGTANIYMVDTAGGEARALTHHPSSNGLASWSRDGRWVYFFSDRTGRHEIWRVPSSGGDSQQVTFNGGWNAFESVDGKRLYYTKDVVSPLFAKPVDGGEERQLDVYIGRTRDFVVVEDGIYYGGKELGGVTPFHFYSFATGKSKLLFKVDGSIFFGLTVSPDRKSILFPRSLDYGTDLMMVEGFR